MQKIIEFLPVAVVLIFVAMCINHLIEKHQLKVALEAEEKSATATLIKELPRAEKVIPEDQGVAEKAFRFPDTFCDDIPTQPLSSRADTNLFSSDLRSMPSFEKTAFGPGQERTTKPTGNKIAGEQPSDSASLYFEDHFTDQRSVPLNSGSEAYQKRVDKLMDMRRARMARSNDDP